jgi:hypothetical protein
LKNFYLPSSTRIRLLAGGSTLEGAVVRGGTIFVALSVVGTLVLATSGQIAAATRKPQAAEPKKDLEVSLPNELPAGPLHIIVSIGKQRAELYSNGEPILKIPVSTGTAEHPTPTGVFSILQKNTWHESNIYSAAPMPFMQRITWSGVALHEGVLPGYPASHGCIRMPHSFATWLFGFTDLGVRVIVTNDEPKMEDISHPLLFTSKTVSGPGDDRTSQESGNVYRASVSTSVPRKLASIDADAGNPQDAARINTIAVFISKKEGRLFVRRNFAPLFDAPVRFENRQRPIGTHVFTAMDFKNGGPEMRWSAVSMKSEDTSDELHDLYGIKERWVDGRMIKTASFSRERWTPLTPSEVLDRIYIPQEAIDRISELLIPGSSLIVSDEGLNKETRKHTEFVVLTSPSAAFLKPESAEQDRRRTLRQEPVTRLQPVEPQSPQRVKPETVPRLEDRRPIIRPTNVEPAAPQPSQGAKPETTSRVDEQRSISRPTNMEPAAPQPSQRAKPETAPRVDERRSISRPRNVEPAAPQSSQRAIPETAARAEDRRSISRPRNTEPAAPQLQRANFDAAPRVDDRRSISRPTNVEPAARKIDLIPP